jgi:outer membrane lipoprotein-sorting protein
MPTLVLSFVLLIVTLLPTLASAQDAISLDQILTRHYQAIGGLDAWRGVDTMKQVGKTSAAGSEASFTSYTKRPNLFRLEFEISGMAGHQVFDGNNAWIVIPFMGNDDPQALPPETQAQMRIAAIDGLLVDWQRKQHQLELVGSESIDGRPHHHLGLQHAAGAEVDCYLDAETYLLSRARFRTPLGEQTIDNLVSYTDYREVDGLKVAHQITESGAGGSRIMTLESVVLNPSLDAGLFQVEAAAATASEPTQSDSSDPTARRTD